MAGIRDFLQGAIQSGINDSSFENAYKSGQDQNKVKLEDFLKGERTKKNMELARQEFEKMPAGARANVKVGDVDYSEAQFNPYQRQFQTSKAAADERVKADKLWNDNVGKPQTNLQMVQLAENELAHPDVGTMGRLQVLIPKMGEFGRMMQAEITRSLPESKKTQFNEKWDKWLNQGGESPVTENDLGVAKNVVARFKDKSLNNYNAGLQYIQDELPKRFTNNIMQNPTAAEDYIASRMKQTKGAAIGGDFNTPVYNQPGQQAAPAQAQAPAQPGMGSKIMGGLASLFSPSKSQAAPQGMPPAQAVQPPAPPAMHPGARTQAQGNMVASPVVNPSQPSPAQQSLAGTMPRQAGAAKMIRVKEKKTGRTGQISSDEYSPDEYDIVGQ